MQLDADGFASRPYLLCMKLPLAEQWQFARQILQFLSLLFKDIQIPASLTVSLYINWPDSEGEFKNPAYAIETLLDAIAAVGNGQGWRRITGQPESENSWEQHTYVFCAAAKFAGGCGLIGNGLGAASKVL